MEYSRLSHVQPFRVFSRGRFLEKDRMKFEQDAAPIPSTPPIDAKCFSAARKRRRSISETMVQQPAAKASPIQAVVQNPAPTKKKKQADSHDRISLTNNQRTDTNTCITSSKTQLDIGKIIQMLQDYANGSNDSNFTVFESIPSLLFGVVGTHFQSDLGATTLSIQTILEYCSGRVGATTTNPTIYHRHRILRELFRKALVSGGTEHALQAIQQLGVTYWRTTKNRNANQQIVQAQYETLLGCWKIVRAGIESSLSGNLCMLVVQACLADLDEVQRMNDKDVANHSEIFSSILVALAKALSNEELMPEHLAPERPAILTHCGAVLSKACMCGKAPQEATASNDGPSDDNEHDGNAIPLIEDALEILVVCAQKRLLLSSDFQSIVPACTACLNRYILSGNSNEAIDRSIPMKVVQLIEAEDATAGRWLRETYGLPSPLCMENSNRLQDSILARDHKSSELVGSLPPHDNNLEQSSPMNQLPPQVSPAQQYRTHVICDPNDTDSDEDE